MKKALVFASILLLLASCDVIVVDPQPAYDQRDKFTGNYRVDEYSTTYDEYWEYSMSIWKSGSRNEVVIDNFYNSGIRAYGTIFNNRLTISWQSVDGYEIQGEGWLNGNKLTLSYQVRDTYSQPSPRDFCEATAWRNY